MPTQFTPPITAGIDLGATHAQIGLVDGTGRLLARSSMMTNPDKGHEDIIARLGEAVEEVCAQADIKLADIHGLGIGAPGVIDLSTGTVIEAPNIRWQNVPLAERLGRHLGGIRVVVDNDVNTATLGECAYGSARDVQNALGVWVGTGVGGAVVCCGRIAHGGFGSGGEIGQSILYPDAPKNKRLLEHHTSRGFVTKRIIARIAQGEPSKLDVGGRVTAANLREALDEGDEIVRDEIARAARLLGIGIANVLCIIASPVVILGGGLTEVMGQAYAQLVSESIEAHLFPKTGRPTIDVRLTELRENAGLIGAAVMAR